MSCIGRPAGRRELPEAGGPDGSFSSKRPGHGRWRSLAVRTSESESDSESESARGFLVSLGPCTARLFIMVTVA